MLRSQPIVTLIVLISAFGCDRGVPTSPRPFLFERMGGQAVITASVDSFYAMLKEDRTMWRAFKPVLEDESGQRATRFKTMMATLMCRVGGGACSYEGLSMSDAHADMDVSGLEFDAMIEHLDRALHVNNVGAEERKEMVTIFNQMKHQIVR